MTEKSIYRTWIKRMFDIVMSVLLLISTSWLFALIFLLYVIFFQFPIFFTQKRVGKRQQEITVLKFRTLSVTDLPLTSRRFWLGDLLRATSLDELPQLVNVLKGDMSFVGPRPLPIEYLPLFSEEQQTRHLVKPGITGWAQVNGRNAIPWKKKFELDLYYVEHCSFFLDMKIVFKTILLLLSFKKDVSLEESKFTGNHE